MNQMTDVSGQALTYDFNGNLIDDGTNQYIWDTEDLLIQVKKKSDGSTIASYEYDSQGRRIRSTVGGTITNYVYDGESLRVLYETDGSNQLTRYYNYSVGGGLLSMVKKTGPSTYDSYYYHTNAHGDVIAVTDENNQVIASYTYDAWGNILSKSGSFADENPYRYAGYRYDQETGLYYLIARYYSSERGNFLSLDPDSGDWNSVITQNGYTYANNNPVNGVDPVGEYIPGSDGEKYVENPKTGWGRMTGNKKYPHHNGRYYKSKQVSVDGANLLYHVRDRVKKMGLRAGEVKNKLVSSKDWNFKLRKDMQGLEVDIYGEIYKNGGKQSPLSKLGNMAVGAAGNELDINLNIMREIDGYYQAKFDNKSPWSCATWNGGFVSCDPDDVKDVKAGYKLGEKPLFGNPDWYDYHK